MSASNRNPFTDDQLLDLLVDDELTESQRHELLCRLDQLPDGWRRRALAFLEAQCWKQEAGALVGQTARPAEPARRAVLDSPGVFRWGTLLAMAASFLVALGLGVVARDAWRGGVLWSPDGAATVASSQPALPGAPATRPGSLPGDSPWQMVTLAADRGQGEADTFRLPAREKDRVDEDWLNRPPTAIPPDVVRALEARGMRVQQSRHLLPLPMQDGRRLVVPMDQVDLHYIGGSGY